LWRWRRAGRGRRVLAGLATWWRPSSTYSGVAAARPLRPSARMRVATGAPGRPGNAIGVAGSGLAFLPVGRARLCCQALDDLTRTRPVWHPWRAAASGRVRCRVRRRADRDAVAEVGKAAGGVGAVAPGGQVDGGVEVSTRLAERFGAEHAGRVDGPGRADRAGGDGVAEAGGWLGARRRVVEFAAVFGGPFEDPDGWAHGRQAASAQLVEDDGFVRRRRWTGQGQGSGGRHRGFRTALTSLPVAPFPQFINVELVDREATAGFAVAGRIRYGCRRRV